jgi:hypothetical protein
VSSAILYGAIVVIWAGVLIPRWLRRETSAEEVTMTSDAGTSASGPAPASAPATVPATVPAEPGPDLEPERPGSRDSEHARVIGARRRLLGMLLVLAIGAGVLAVMKLAAWWVVLPPSVMLIGYIALLREASRADAERRSAAFESARAASGGATVAAPVAAAAPAPVAAAAPDAEIIDITARVELYDQVADAKLRAVGD